MKKITGLFAILGLMLMAVQAQAIELGIYERGVLVPSVYHDGASIDTVVGLICQDTTAGCTDHNTTSKTQIWWTFFDVDSHHVTDGVLPCTDDDLVPFSWKANSGRNLDKVSGYLVFATANANFKISANAFLVDTAKKDAIFIPVIPLIYDETEDIYDLNGNFTRTDMKVINLNNGTKAGNTLDVRYWMDPTYNAATTIVVWLVDPYLNGTKALPLTVLAYNDNEEAKSVTITLPHELNKIIPCEIPGLPTNYVDGFIQMTLPDSPTVTAGIAYSYISSTLFGAQQTLLAAECEGGERNIPDRNVPSCGCSGAGY